MVFAREQHCCVAYAGSSQAQRRADTRDDQKKKAPAFSPFPLATFLSPCTAPHRTATQQHTCLTYPWPRLPGPEAGAPNRTRARTPRATRARRQGEGEIPRDKRAAPGSSGQVLAPPSACPAFDGWAGGGADEEGDDARQRTRETGQGQGSQPRTTTGRPPPLPSPRPAFDAFEAEPQSFLPFFWAPLLRCLCCVSMCE